MGLRRIINPAAAGAASRTTPRSAAASELRSSSSLPNACCAENVGMAAMATDCAIAAWAMSMREKPYWRPATLPLSIWDANQVFTQKLSCTTPMPAIRGSISRKTSRTAGSLNPRVRAYGFPISAFRACASGTDDGWQLQQQVETGAQDNAPGKPTYTHARPKYEHAEDKSDLIHGRRQRRDKEDAVGIQDADGQSTQSEEDD